MLRYNGRVIETGGFRGQYSHVIREFRITGRSSAVTTIADLWAPGSAISGNHSLQPAAGVILAVSSTNVNDTALGSGASVVGVVAVGIDYTEMYFLLPLNGQTKVTDASARKIVGVNEMYVGPVWVLATLNGTTTVKVPSWVTDNMVTGIKVASLAGEIQAGSTVASSTPGNLVLSAAATVGTATLPVNVWIAIGSGAGNLGKVEAYDSTDAVTLGENQTIAKRMSILDIGDNHSKAGWYTVPKVGNLMSELIILTSKTNVLDATATQKFAYSQITSNFVKKPGEILYGIAGGTTFFPFDQEADSTGGGASDWQPANIFEPVIIIPTGGTLNLRGSSSAAAGVATECIAWGLLAAVNNW